MSVTVFLDADEITAEAYTIDVSRGRALEGDVFNPGGGTIRVRNYEANFNPAFLVQTFALLQENGDDLLLENNDRILLESANGGGVGAYGEIELGREVVVKDGAVTVFTGYVEDFDYVYGVDNRSEAVLTVRDALATLGSTNLSEWETTAQQSGARITALLDRPEVEFPALGRDIATGSQPLAAGTVSFGTNALQEAQRINKAESGRLFVDGAGTLTFQDRYESFGKTPTATFSDDGTNLPFSDIQVRFGSELLHFAVAVKREGTDSVEQVTDYPSLAGAAANLGVRQLTLSNMPLGSDYHAYGLALFLQRRFLAFEAVVSGLTVPLGRLSTSDRATVCGLEIGDVVTVSFVPYGTTGAVTQILAIEGVSYSFRASQNASGTTTSAFVTFQLSNATDPDYFTVGTDSVNGTKLLAP